MSSFKLAIIGCGAATKRYYVPALKRHPKIVQNLYLVDKNMDYAQELSAEFGGGEIFDDYREVIGRVHGALIALPNFLHYPVSMNFLNAGVHVLWEKPLAETTNEVIEMNQAAEKNNVALCVNNTRRMFPTFKEIKKIIAKGKIGKLKSIDYVEGNTFAWPSATGFYVDPAVSSKGVLIDIGPHVMDLICWWLDGKPIVSEFNDDSFGGPESVANIKAEYDNCKISIFLNRLSDLECHYEIKGELGTLKGDVFEWNKFEISKNSGEFIEMRVSCSAKNYPEFVVPVIDNFIKVVAGDEKSLISGTDVQDSIEIIEECYENRTRFKLPWYDNITVASENAGGKTLVTGATGFIGGRIVEVLHLTNDRKVRAGIRQWSSAARLGRFPVDIVKMDLMEKEEVEKALDGITEIVHCAKGPGRVTVQGTRNLLEIALKKGIKRFVHMSTTEIYGDVSGKINEDTPFNYTGNEYNQTKIDAEKACWEYYKKGLPITVIRPSIVYGPFSNNWSVHFAKMFIAGKWGIYEKYGAGKCNLVYIDDLVRAILLALDCENAVGHAFNIGGPEVITWNEYFKKYNEMMGLPPLKTINTTQANFRTAMMEPVRILGRFVRDHFMGPVKKIAETFDFAKRMMKQTENALKTSPSPGELKLFNKNAVFSCNKAKELLRFNPSVSVDEGLNRTIEWLKHQGFFLK